MSPVQSTEQKVVEVERLFPATDCGNKISEYYGMLHSDVIMGKDAPQADSTVDAKLCWLRSQIIGGSAEIQTPFGARKLTYADHTATGRCLQYIEEYIIKNLLPYYGNTHTCDNYVGDRTMKMVKEATKYVKKCLGGTEDDALLFCGSGTTAAIKRLQEVMAISIPSTLKEKLLTSSCLQSTERWVVFVGPYEHHSNLLSWRQSLAQVVEIGLDEEGFIDMNDLKLQLEYYQPKGHPMLGSFSACSNVTGICSDTRSLSRLLHQFGAFACFDFAASGPYVKIDMRSDDVDGYDAIFLSPHKFLGGPGTPGILLMSKALYHLKYAPPSTCGGGTVNFVNCFSEQDTVYINDIEEREDAGTPQIIQRVKAALAFHVKEEYIRCEVIAKKEVDYIERALNRFEKHSNIWVLGNTNVDRQPILSFLVNTNTTPNNKQKPLHGGFVAKLLNDLFGIQARGGCACAGPYAHRLLGIDQQFSVAIKSAIKLGYNGAKLGWTRVSFPYYMCNEEFEFIIDAIEYVGVYGHRFLPLYKFNWYTGSWNFKTSSSAYKDKDKDCKLCRSFYTAANDDETQDRKTPDDAHLYAFYMKIAKHIGNLLPNVPSQCLVPKDIDPSHVFFQV